MSEYGDPAGSRRLAVDLSMDQRLSISGFGSAGRHRLPAAKAVGQAIWASMLVAVVAGAGCMAVRRGPGNDPVLASRQLSLRGLDAMHAQRWDEAESLFKSAIETHAANDDARRQYADVLWRRGNREEAVRQMEEAIRLSGGDPALHVQLGEMYLELGDLQRAWQQAEEALAAHRQSAAAWALRGDVLRRRGNAEEALASYHRATTYQPRYPRVQMAVAEIYQEQSRPRRTLATLQLLAEQYGNEPPPTEVLVMQGLAFKALGRYTEAIDSFVAARQRGEPTAALLYHLGESHWLAGDLANADLAIRAALASDPNHEPSRRLGVEIESRQRYLTAGLESGRRGS